MRKRCDGRWHVVEPFPVTKTLTVLMCVDCGYETGRWEDLPQKKIKPELESYSEKQLELMK